MEIILSEWGLILMYTICAIGNGVWFLFHDFDTYNYFILVGLLNLIFMGFQYYYSFLWMEMIMIGCYHIFWYQNFKYLQEDIFNLLLPWMPIIWAIILWIQYYSLGYFLSEE